MVNFCSFSDELVKISEDKRERVREAVRQSVAAGLGTGAGIAAADLLVSYIERKKPHLAPVLRSKAMKYGVPAALAAGSIYASQKYKKNVDDAWRKVREQQ